MSSFSLALDRLKKFNRFVIENQELADVFIHGEYNFLQAYQTPIFHELVSYSDTKKTVTRAVETASQAGLAVRMRQLFAVGFSLCSYVFLMMSRRPVLVFTADKDTYSAYQCDFRMVNLFQYLFDHKVKFVEIFHTIFRHDFIACALRRRRPSLYLEAGDVVYTFARMVGLLSYPTHSGVGHFDFSSAEEDSEMFRGLVERYAERINRSRFRIHILSWLLKRTGVKKLVAAADLRNYHEVIAACNAAGIKTYAFQSGNLSKYSVGYLNYGGPEGRLIKPTKIMLETGYWKRELQRWGTYFREDEIEVGGSVKEDYAMMISQHPRDIGHGVDLTILIPYEIIAPKDEILSYIRKFLTFDRVRVVFKFRADRDLADQAREYGLKGLSGNLMLITDLKEIPGFDIVAGTYSTFLYEMIGQLKPAIVLKTSLDYGEGLIANSLADEININDINLSTKFQDIKETSIEILRARRYKLYGEVTPLAVTLDKILKF